MAFSYYKQMTLAAAQAGSADSTNWPLTIGVGVGPQSADANLKTVGNGGHVQSSSGYDIRPYADSALTSALTYELVFYDGSTGSLEMHVKIPTLSHTSDTVIYLAYGNSSLVSDGSSSGTWNSSYKAVYHFKDGSSLSMADSTSNGNNATNNSARAVSGQIDGAAGTDAGNESIQLPMTDLSSFTSGSIEWWLFDTIAYNAGSVHGFWSYLSGSQELGAQIFSDGNYYIGWSVTGHDDRVSVSASGQSVNTWYHYVYTWADGGTSTLYRNGSSIGTHAITAGDVRNLSTNMYLFISNINFPLSTFMTGKIDEWRLTNAVASSSYVLASYNSQKASSTFISWGTETPVGTITSGGLIPFFF